MSTVLIDFGEDTPRAIDATEAKADRYMWLADFFGPGTDEHDFWLSAAEQVYDACTER
jgi:hypothetical protein